jgi:polyisoprenoid-binding protein YceI
MAARYRFDPSLSRFTVQAFASGLLSFLGHSPTFAVRDFAGFLRFDGSPVQGLKLEVNVKAAALELVENVKPTDRREIEDTMRRDVLETEAYTEITYQATDASANAIAQGRYRLRIGGRLSLHGVTRPHAVDAELLVFDDGVRLRGESWLRLSDYRIRPVTALGGTIKLKDELRVSFDIAGLPEGP